MEFTRLDFLRMIDDAKMGIVSRICTDVNGKIPKTYDDKIALLDQLHELELRVSAEHDKIILIGIKD